MDRTKVKLKDLKYQIEGVETPKVIFEVCSALFILPATMMTLLFLIALVDTLVNHPKNSFLVMVVGFTLIYWGIIFSRYAIRLYKNWEK